MGKVFQLTVFRRRLRRPCLIKASLDSSKTAMCSQMIAINGCSTETNIHSTGLVGAPSSRFNRQNNISKFHVKRHDSASSSKPNDAIALLSDDDHDDAPIRLHHPFIHSISPWGLGHCSHTRAIGANADPITHSSSIGVSPAKLPHTETTMVPTTKLLAAPLGLINC